MTISTVLLPACTARFPGVDAAPFTTAASWQGAPEVSEAYSLHDVKTVLLFLITDNQEENTLTRWPIAFCEMHDKMLSLEQLLTRFNMNPSLPSGEKLLQYVDDIRLAQQQSALPGENGDDITAQLTALQQAIQAQLNKIQHQIRDDKLNNKASLARSESMAHHAQDVIPDEESQPTLHRARRSVDARSEPFTTSTSYADLWAEIVNVIAGVKTNYVDFYGNLLQKYTEMYDEYNKTVQKVAADSTHSGKEANSVNFDEPNLRKYGYQVFNNWIGKTPLGSVPDWDKMSPSQQKEMVATLEPAFKVSTDGKVSFNKDTFDSVSLAKVTDDGSYTDVSTTRYQAWLASFNSVSSAFQSNMQSFAQRYSQANSTFDNLNKVLSSVISTLGESAREVLKALS
ncbi:IpaD/SipD/SspD family type III secretion system needle tip protein [Candidatus Symbiopectobacterium sp. NZEC151]|uniref:IpaD/SipD/SspD family type III secretion system needle tip protein n=3 Tax=unclassified Symbiopectobacterium TaxID=2794573 RepID=UPI0022277F18|nr:IpaD/SipD/SspD family type III secretion system needle tip protein [Candidatus Symbiopectobacterium sp. NZEC151]MCW2474851.1 IpaD/SipD/SspD family type III secretion system needle tip protein [Candidatus Symbiopectobacterium sp. NZEC151]